MTTHSKKYCFFLSQFSGAHWNELWSCGLSARAELHIGTIRLSARRVVEE
jgi:hypothetical protein